MSEFPPLDSAALPPDAVEVGRISDAWGVKGWFKVLAHSAHPQALFTAPQWFLQPPERGAKTFSSTRVLPMRQIRPHSDTIVASAEGVNDRNAAQMLRGARVFVSRSHFPAPQPDEYYWVDLIGLQVKNREGVALGRVRELLASGPQTTLVITEEPLDAGGKACERMIPFVAAFVDTVDVAGGWITVDWQPDY